MGHAPQRAQFVKARLFRDRRPSITSVGTRWKAASSLKEFGRSLAEAPKSGSRDEVEVFLSVRLKNSRGEAVISREMAPSRENCLGRLEEMPYAAEDAALRRGSLAV